jgi:hypothetical protein
MEVLLTRNALWYMAAMGHVRRALPLNFVLNLFSFHFCLHFIFHYILFLLYIKFNYV